jgi:hypothetical protein
VAAIRPASDPAAGRVDAEGRARGADGRWVSIGAPREADDETPGQARAPEPDDG